MTAAPIPAAILPRVASLLRLLGSDVDGEALGAARALRRTLGGAGLDLHALAEAVERPAERVVVVERREPTPPRRRAGPAGFPLPVVQARKIAGVLSRASASGLLSAWEVEFTASVVPILRGPMPSLSARQVHIVERLVSKQGGVGL